MTNERFAFGDRVRHRKLPEWGVGSVVKAEDLPPTNGVASQRLSVRFPGVGVKRLSTAHADLERATEEATAGVPDDAGGGGRSIWDALDEADWLAPLTRRKIDEAMTLIPEAARDPFRTLRDRLESTLALYRFSRTGHSLFEWATAQTGLDDPLSRFNRHELEQYFDRWVTERDAHLARLMAEAAGEGRLVESLLAGAPPAARKAVRRHAAVR